VKCRFCGNPVTLPFIDLVAAPPSNSYLTAAQLDEPETYYPLKVLVCESCWLVQIDEYKKSSEIFDGTYAYFASYSSSWLEHCRNYVDMAVSRFGLSASSFVVEVASNDGYLLQYVKDRGIPCLGIEPTASTAAAAREKGVATIEEFFGAELAERLVAERGRADLIIANNVLAHVPDINDFVEGFRIALKPGGTATFEFPHVLNLLRYNQFDTIYHEHFSYLSLTVVREILAAHSLAVYDVQELPTHGGSLRVFVRHEGSGEAEVQLSVKTLEIREREAGLTNASGYRSLQAAADRIRAQFLEFLIGQKRQGKRVAAYGAAAKGNTLLNYCGIKGTDLISYVIDRSPHKQGMFLPGSHIPIVHEERLDRDRPDFILLLPWNIKDEIIRQLSGIHEWGGRFVVSIPHLRVLGSDQ